MIYVRGIFSVINWLSDVGNINKNSRYLNHFGCFSACHKKMRIAMDDSFTVEVFDFLQDSGLASATVTYNERGL